MGPTENISALLTLSIRLRHFFLGSFVSSSGDVISESEKKNPGKVSWQPSCLKCMYRAR